MKRLVVGAAIFALLSTSGCSAVSTANKVRNLANGNTAKEVQDFQKRAEAAKNLTYTAAYDSQSAGTNKAEKIRIVQKPPKSLYAQGDTVFIDNGSRTITCSPDSSQGNKMQCLDVGPTGANPATFTQLFSAPALLQSLAVFAILPGVAVTKPTRNLAGENLDCVRITISKENKHVESCVTSDGVLGFYDTGDGNTFTLTSIKRSAADKDFDAPAKPVTADELSKQLQNQATSTTLRSTTTTTESSSSTDTSETTDTTAP